MEDLNQAVQSLGLSKYQHIFLCADQTEAKCCDVAAGLAAWDYLKNRLKGLHLVGSKPQVFRTKANCLRVSARAGSGGVPEGAVPLVYMGAGANHSGTFDRRARSGGVRICPCG